MLISKKKLLLLLGLAILFSYGCSSLTTSTPTPVDLGPLRITPPIVADARANMPITFTAHGGTGVYKWHLVGGQGTAPQWDNVVLVFTPIVPGRFILELSCEPQTYKPVQFTTNILP
jgi:hypothetical protein